MSTKQKMWVVSYGTTKCQEVECELRLNWCFCRYPGSSVEIRVHQAYCFGTEIEAIKALMLQEMRLRYEALLAQERAEQDMANRDTNIVKLQARLRELETLKEYTEREKIEATT